jgi:hypothetical protein
MAWVIQNFRPDYKCYEFYTGERDGIGRPVWAYDLVCAVAFDTKVSASFAFDWIKKHQKNNPHLWHKPIFQGGYGRDRVTLKKITAKQFEKIKGFRDGREEAWRQGRISEAEHILKGTGYKVVKG